MTGSRERASAALQRGAVYRRLGVEPIINGRSTFTILGASLMPTEVLDAMRDAADSFVDLVELHDAVGRRIAELTHNEAAFVSGGAAAGLFLSAAAAMTRNTRDGILRLGEIERLPRDFVIHRAHRIPYETAIELAGGRLIEIGGSSTTEQQLEEVIGDGTAAVLYVDKAHLASQVLPLQTVIRVARGRDIPVIVDAAAQLPPVHNLWRYTEAGADIAIFSGGKGLCGPASTGLVLGRRRFVERVGVNAAPLQRLGRPMKLGKEDLIGVLAAVEWYLRQDHGALAARFDGMVAHFVRWGGDRDGIVVAGVPLGEAGQPTPRAHLAVRGQSPADRDRFLAELRATTPRIDLLADEKNGFYVAPETLLPGEELIITDRLSELLDRPRLRPDRRSRRSRQVR